jgi:hypothetical protein
MSLTHSAAQLALKHHQDSSQEILRAVEELKNGSGFGSVEIVLHEGRVTQIEKREKLRFTQDSSKKSPTAQARVK